ncbi:MAG: peptidylprolyl isomerase [Gammaproteobacteria bacterium]|nr:peptidylprolyl isomerase [Gammaproteobacteria bacterium]
MTYPIPVAALLLGLTLTAPLALAADASDNNPVIAIINGTPVNQRDYAAFVRMRSDGHPERLNAQQQQALQDEFINRELLYQDALAQQLDKLPMVITEVNNQRLNILSGARINQLAANPPGDDELKKVYKEQFSKPVTEYHTRHILVKTEGAARDIVAQLAKGGDFAALAKAQSIDTSGDKGGDIGWFSLDKMVPQYAAVVAKLNTGAISPAPVQTRFGWHVIRLEGTRETPPPAFDAVKGQISQYLLNQRVAAYIKSLRDKATIEIPNGKK